MTVAQSSVTNAWASEDECWKAYFGSLTGMAFMSGRARENDPATIMMYVQMRSIWHLPATSG